MGHIVVESSFNKGNPCHIDDREENQEWDLVCFEAFTCSVTQCPCKATITPPQWGRSTCVLFIGKRMVYVKQACLVGSR
ncbi:hypothetical protein CROQUDRAFT_650351 [Cronartium quercuum f. sp. fusiforme G11]|uniref:Uncharacterized protein n=1 Tax=Cronartium quercuum f. sp. fusiforme G11 TaxID=708437 RepID=A0A9P6NV97_9BASI|nr:hypothetical protein CROQUDRAFT_650351 [Cronartium quercuum f. sp. fusiforme G11]